MKDLRPGYAPAVSRRKTIIRIWTSPYEYCTPAVYLPHKDDDRRREASAGNANQVSLDPFPAKTFDHISTLRILGQIHNRRCLGTQALGSNKSCSHLASGCRGKPNHRTRFVIEADSISNVANVVHACKADPDDLRHIGTSQSHSSLGHLPRRVPRTRRAVPRQVRQRPGNDASREVYRLRIRSYPLVTEVEDSQHRREEDHYHC